jgi:hypothetical protein
MRGEMVWRWLKNEDGRREVARLELESVSKAFIIVVFVSSFPSSSPCPLIRTYIYSLPHPNCPFMTLSAHCMRFPRLPLQAMFLIGKRIVPLLVLREDGRDKRRATAHSHMMSITH